MHTIGRLIRARRKELRLTLRQVSERAACAQSYLSQIENGRRDRPPSRAMLERLERALRLDSGRLTQEAQWQATPENVRREVVSLRRKGEMARRMAAALTRKSLDELHESGELQRLVDRFCGPDDAGRPGALGGARLLGALPAQVPVINRVAAGYPVEFTDLSYPARVADEYVSVPDVSDADAFAARVVGDSMEPQYREGDIVVFSPAADTPPGSDCFVRFERDAETTFKRVYFELGPDGAERIRLQPLNSAHPPRVVEREEVAGLYAAVYVVRPVGAVGVRRGLGA